ncbi:MAG: TonB-dependent receptor, partial [Ignavibacteriaceae bacterium]
MKKVLNKIIILLGILLLSSMSNAQTGKISGRIVDAKTKEALPFVNVIVIGTNLGAATDVDGYYSIIGISPGTYTLKASAIGYGNVNYDNVKVSIDLTTKINFELSETSIQTATVTIVARRPLVTKDLTSTTAVVDANEIAALPVTEFQEILNLKAGMVGGSVRGGRSGEVVYAIDGVPVTDVYDGSTVVDINTNSIQELQFVSGAFNAEYGRALSGYVNIATKDGTNNFHGSLTGYLGSYLTNHSDIFPSDNSLKPTHIR